jgi:hypothetical protein
MQTVERLKDKVVELRSDADSVVADLERAGPADRFRGDREVEERQVALK